MDKYNKDIIAINDVGADPKVFHPLMSKLMWMKDLLPLASFKYRNCFFRLYKKEALRSCYGS